MQSKFTVAATGQSLIKLNVRGEEASGFKAIQRLLKDADLAFTNFESTIYGTHKGWPLKGSYFGSSDPLVLDALKGMGFQALSLSNNHAFDLGPSGILSTLEEVEKREFLHAGIGRNHDEAGQANTKTFNGRSAAIVAMDGGPGPDFMYAANASDGRPERPGVNRLRMAQIIEVDDVAFNQLRAVKEKVGYSAVDLANDSQPDDPRREWSDEVGISRAVFQRSDGFGRSVRIDSEDLARNLTAIAEAALHEGIVIAYLHHHHWAADWYQVPEWVAGVARQCIDAGAAMFVSHGAPVLQPVEIYKGRPIFYSLGNFIFHVRSEETTWTAPEVWESVVALCTFNDQRELSELTFHPVLIGGEEALNSSTLEKRLVPHLATGRAAERILNRLAHQSARLGTTIEVEGGKAVARF